MAYSFTNSKGNTYYLHTKKSMTSTGKERTLFFFAKEMKEGTLDAVPAGYDVVEMKTGLPVLKKSGGAAEAVSEAMPESQGN